MHVPYRDRARFEQHGMGLVRYFRSTATQLPDLGDAASAARLGAQIFERRTRFTGESFPPCPRPTQLRWVLFGWLFCFSDGFAATRRFCQLYA